MSYVTDQLKEVQPLDQGRQAVPVKVKFISAWGQSNYLTVQPSVFAEIARILKEADDGSAH